MPFARQVFYVEKQDATWLLVHFGYEASSIPTYLEFNGAIFKLAERQIQLDEFYSNLQHFKNYKLKYPKGTYGEYELFDVRGVTAKPKKEV